MHESGSQSAAAAGGANVQTIHNVNAGRIVLRPRVRSAWAHYASKAGVRRCRVAPAPAGDEAGRCRPHRSLAVAAVGWRTVAACVVLLALPNAAHADIRLDRWCEIATPDFRLLTDLPPRRAIRLADSLTRFKIAAETLVPRRKSPAPPPLRIVAMRRGRDFREVFAAKKMAGFMQSGLERHTLAFGPDPGTGAITETAFHEYTHYLMRSRQGLNIPVWYEEGFASFLSTMRFSDTAVTIGAAPLQNFRRLNVRKLSVAELVGERHSLNWGRHDLTRLYAKAWLFVHMLELGDAVGLPPYRERLPRLLALTDAGVAAPQALHLALGAGPAALERQVRRYGGRRALPTRRLAIETRPTESFAPHCLTALEAAYELGAAAAARNPAFAARRLTEVVAAQPRHADAWAALSGARQNLAEARQAARRALAVDASHVLANTRMAELKVAECRGMGTDECLDVWEASARHYRRALDGRADAVDAAYGLGVVYLNTGQAGNAVNYLRVAWRRAPWAPRVNFYLGEAYRLTGDDARARVHLRKAMNWDPDARWRERAALALGLLDAAKPDGGAVR